MGFRYEEIDKMNKNNITMGEFFNLFSFGSSVPVIITLSDGIQDDMIDPIYEGFLSDTPIWLSNHCLITKVPKDVEDVDLIDYKVEVSKITDSNNELINGRQGFYIYLTSAPKDKI
jgi:hypothetical protein